MSEEAAARISVIQVSQAQQAKSVTNNDRKDRLLSQLFDNTTETVVKLNLHRGILCLFQSYVKTFQSEKPLMHKLHYEMYRVTREILGLFIRPEKIPVKVKELLALDPTDMSIQKADRDLAVGHFAYVDLNKARMEKANMCWVSPLYTSLRAGYIKAASMLLKLPMANPTLKRMAVLNPTHVSFEATPKALRLLARELPNVISETEQGQLAMEAGKYSVDPDVLLIAEAYKEETMRIDRDYWKKVFDLREQGEVRYKTLKTLVSALLSIFVGPLVESTFNIMDDIIEKDRASM